MWSTQSSENKNSSFEVPCCSKQCSISFCVIERTVVLGRWLAEGSFVVRVVFGMNRLLHLSGNVTHQILPKYQFCAPQSCEHCEILCHLHGMFNRLSSVGFSVIGTGCNRLLSFSVKRNNTPDTVTCNVHMTALF